MNSSDNLTGGQIQQVLDLLIQQSIFPIIHTSAMFDEQISYLLHQVSTNKKRKVSALPANEFTSLLCQYLDTSDTAKKCAILTIAKIDRGFIYNFVVDVLTDLKPAIHIYQKYISSEGHAKERWLKKLNVISKSTGIPVESIYPVYFQSLGYLDLMYTFRNSIVMQYERLAHSMAKKVCARSNTFDYHDLVSNLMVATVKAVDKYDSSKGALTTYIKWWLMNAQTSVSTHGHEYGVAYSIPSLHRKNLAVSPSSLVSNYGVSINTLLKGDDADQVLMSDSLSLSGIDNQLEVEESNTLFLKLAKRADPLGLARLYLGIDEYFFPEELRKMRRMMKKQKTVKNN